MQIVDRPEADYNIFEGESLYADRVGASLKPIKSGPLNHQGENDLLEFLRTAMVTSTTSLARTYEEASD